MSLEQQVQEALRDVAGHVMPDPARAYERFRVRRQRWRVVAVPALAAALLALVLVTAVIVAQVRPEPVTPVHPSPTSIHPSPEPTPSSPAPLEPVPGPDTVEVPAAGFAIEVPAGWVATVDRDRDVVSLGPEEEPGGSMGFVDVRTIAVDPELGPGRGEVYPDDLSRPTIGFESPPGPHEYSRRPDGRRVLKAGEPSPTDTGYYVAWPYYCAADESCPIGTKLRTLVVHSYTPETASPEVRQEVRQVRESIVANARPITNALEGGDGSTPRDGCGHPSRLWDGAKHNGPTAEGTVVYQVAFRNAWVVPCDLHLELSLRVVENGRPAQVLQSPPTVVIDGRSPEEVARPADSTAVAWRWMNWCGDPGAELQLVVNGEADPIFDPDKPAPPLCTHPDDPSSIDLLSFEE